MTVELFCGDCLNVMPDAIPDESINLAFVDPPYNIGIFCKMPPAEYLDWCEQWIALVSRKLAPNGAFWVSHKNPRILGQLADMIEAHGRGLINWITWDKYHVDEHSQIHALPDNPGLRSFAPIVEYLIYHADEGQWTAQCDKKRGFIFEPLRAYLDSEKNRAGLTTRRVAEEFQKKTGSRTVTGMAGHWFSCVQWTLPTEENYQWLRGVLATHNHGGEYLRREYEDLRREYEDLRREYEDLRYTFNNPGKVSSVWQIPPAKRNGHATPKPEALLERIILATSNPGDVVLDPMMGSGTTGAVAVRLGRSFVGCEIEPRYFEMAKARIEAPQQARMAV